eukprot:TRINITY_DN2251_c0_g1_i4.p1 TRINITY_DN2251_c0_g1~~TRINITY_DN2251_c0_g1_i4.p1  ORF type:complete len:568 (+),score=91.27 TRINITY_DN2251_c0_g1_i4:105-1808(+)
MLCSKASRLHQRVVIVGGIAGGATAAARCRRVDEKASIVLFEKQGNISVGTCGMPYFIGDEIHDRSKLLMQTPESIRRRYNLDIRVNSVVTWIDRQRRCVSVTDLAQQREYQEPYDKLLLATGAIPFRPPLPGIDHPSVYALYKLSDADQLKRLVDTGAKRAIVVGAGPIGVELAEALCHRGLETHLVELLPQVLPAFDPEMAAPAEAELRRQPNLRLHLGTSVKAFRDSPSGNPGDKVVAELADGSTIAADFAVVNIGVRPASGLAKDCGLELGPTGGVKVDEQLCTSDPNIYAVGDLIEVNSSVLHAPMLLPLASPASQQARVAADAIFGRAADYRRAQGTGIVRAFGLCCAVTGATEKALRRANLPFAKVYTHSNQHTSMFPNAVPVTTKLIFSEHDGRILGAQVVGKDGADKRCDVYATAIYAKLTVDDLARLELAYAPPYGAPKDPVNLAGTAASNIVHGDLQVIHPDELGVEPVLPAGSLIDVRTPKECEGGVVRGSVNIPVDSLRQSLGRLPPKGTPLVVYCQSGLRSYLAARILQQEGYDVRSLSGGWLTYKAFHFPAK